MNPLADQIRQATRDALHALDLLERACDTYRHIDSLMPNVSESRIGFDDAFEAVGGWDLDAVLEELRSVATTYDRGWCEHVSRLDRAGIEARLAD